MDQQRSRDRTGDGSFDDTGPTSGIRPVNDRQSGEQEQAAITFCEPVLAQDDAKPDQWRFSEWSSQVDDILDSLSDSAMTSQPSPQLSPRSKQNARAGFSSGVLVAVMVAAVLVALILFWL